LYKQNRQATVGLAVVKLEKGTARLSRPPVQQLVVLLLALCLIVEM
jgi:hypothetical protein